MKKIQMALLISSVLLFCSLPAMLRSKKTYSYKNIPKTNFILLRVNLTKMKACTSEGCFPFKIPGETIAPNFRMQYRVFNSYEITAAESNKTVLWDIKKRTAIPAPLPWGKNKWKEYSVRARFILKNGTTIGDFMETGARNLIYIASNRFRNKYLYNANRYWAGSNHLFQANGSYVFVHAPGTGKNPTAPFSNHVRGFPHTIFYSKSLYGRPQALIKRPALIRLGYFNNGKHIGFMKLGKYKWKKFRHILFEVVNIKTKKARVVGRFFENFSKKKTMWEPRVIYFATMPYVIFESKAAIFNPSGFPNWKRTYNIINIESGKKTPLKLNGYQLTWAIDQHPALYDEVIYSKYIVCHKVTKKGMYFKVLEIPTMKEKMKVYLKKPKGVDEFYLPGIFKDVKHAHYIDHVSQ